jgi:hypothetical protein
LNVLAAQPRSDEFEKQLQDSALSCMKEVHIKLKKDLQQYQKITVDGLYMCSNRFAESVFGHFKKLEEISTAATIARITEQTISRMNKTEEYLVSMPEDKRNALWEQIEGKVELQSLKKARDDMTAAVEKFSIEHKKKQADIEAEKIEKRAAKKRVKAEKENQTPLRKIIPRKKRKILSVAN